MSVELACFLGVIILAIVLDALLIWRGRRCARAQGVGRVHVLGAYSPVLTWLHRVLPAAIVTLIEAHDPPLMTILAGLAFMVYAVTRFIGLNRFPIYFFTDEAVQTVLAADFVHAGWHDYMGRLFPTYFLNEKYFNLSVSVYLQIIPYLLFGKSVIVTRGVSVVVSLFGATAVGLTLRNIFEARWWWAGVLFLSITPAWFLHSRTAFETVSMVSFYAWFLYCYLLYRCRDPRALFASLFFGALAFYSYRGGQVAVLLTGLLFLIADARYHWANRRMALFGLLWLMVLFLPYLRFTVEQPAANADQLRLLGSYWLSRDLTTPQKVGQFVREYALGLSPTYWYWPDGLRDLSRHQMKGYGHLWWPTLPLMLAGLAICLRRKKSAANRDLLIALIAAPVGGALVAVGITRVLMLVIPAALLTAMGLEAAGRWLSRCVSSSILAVVALALLSLANLYMTYDALVNGPTWYRDYGLYGMQYGAEQVFGEIKAQLARAPQTTVLLTSAWANGTDSLLRFFLNDDPRVRLAGIESYLYRREPLSDDALFIMLDGEYARALGSPKFADVRLEKTLPYPDGQAGFYFVRLRYSDQAEAIFAAEKLARQQPVTDQITLKGQRVQVRFSRLDDGQIQNAFDGDFNTLARVEEANPAFVELTFPESRAVSGISLTTGSMDLSLTVKLYPPGNAEPVIYSQSFAGLPDDPTVKLDWGKPVRTGKLYIEIEGLGRGGDFKIHIREIVLQ
jgi:hypothetical protein